MRASSKSLMSKSTPQSIILTGAPGAGKTTILSSLRDQGNLCIPEPAREILFEQRSIAGRGIPDIDPMLFLELILSRALLRHREADQGSGTYFFDRGIPDVIGYARLFGIPFPAAEKATELYRYATPVLFFPAWREIYSTDDERTMSYEATEVFGEQLREVYLAYGYELIEVPKSGIKDRVEFVLAAANPSNGE